MAKIITNEMRRLALREMQRPVGAFDVITTDGALRDTHPLAWIMKGDAAVMATNAVVRRMSRDGTTNISAPRSARSFDQDPAMPPRGREDLDQDQGAGGDITPDDCIQFIQLLLQRLGPGTEEHDELTAKLADLISGAHGNGGMTGDQGLPRNNTQALDRRRGARDNRRAGAQDSAIQALNYRGFDARWGELLKDVTVLGRR